MGQITGRGFAGIQRLCVSERFAATGLLPIPARALGASTLIVQHTAIFMSFLRVLTACGSRQSSGARQKAFLGVLPHPHRQRSRTCCKSGQSGGCLKAWGRAQCASSAGSFILSRRRPMQKAPPMYDAMYASSRHVVPRQPCRERVVCRRSRG